MMIGSSYQSSSTTIDNYWLLLMTIDNYWLLLMTIDDYWWLLTTIDDFWWRFLIMESDARTHARTDNGGC